MKLNINDTLPNFELFDENNCLFKSTEVANKALVIYFYPKDDTPGCTKEACSFRDQYEDFIAANAMVIGVSSDSPESHKNFKEKHRLPFKLLSDPNNELRKKFGVKADLLGLIPGRETFVFDKNSKLIFRFKSQLQAEKHVNEALIRLKS